MTSQLNDPAEIKALATELTVLMAIVSRVSRVDLERHLPPEIGSAVQYGVLRMLRSHPCTLTELSRMLALEPASLTPVIDALERHGLVQRGRDPNDRRRTPLTITVKAEGVLDAFSEFDGRYSLTRALSALGTLRAHECLAFMRDLLGLMTDDAGMAEQVAQGLRLRIATDAESTSRAPSPPTYRSEEKNDFR
ncbi:MAG: MarR family transcriptional regulator [Thermoflexales bacterium]